MRSLSIDHADTYLHRILSNADELDQLIELVLVPETWFFREPGAFVALTALATAHMRQSGRPFRVLSIPCATGEEPYSIAISLLEKGLKTT